MKSAMRSVPRVVSLRVRNYRALKDVELKELTPLTVLLGPNGSGKSTVFDVFAFLAECFTDGLKRAWDRRGRFKELRSRGEGGPISIELKYRESRKYPLITYYLEIEEESNSPVISSEWLRWKRGSHGRPFNFLDFHRGQGEVISGESPEIEDHRIPEALESPSVLAVNTLGQFTRNPRVVSLRKFISGWHLSYFSADSTRTTPEAGPQEQLSTSGDNLSNVIQYLQEQHPDRLNQIILSLRRRIPKLEQVDSEILADGRLLLQIKDAPFDRPVLSKYVSDGTLKMLTYLTLLNDPIPPQLIGIEEPENYLHPRLLNELAEECRNATARTQLLVTTHSPFFINALRPREVWVLYRNEKGFTQACRTSEMSNVTHMMESGALLGDLWMENHFDVGDPLYNAGGPRN